jgi:hypothetical protein
MREEVLLNNFGFGFLNEDPDLPGNSFPFGSDDEEMAVGKDPFMDPFCDPVIHECKSISSKPILLPGLILRHLKFVKLIKLS